jgi:hypothetical protein
MPSRLVKLILLALFNCALSLKPSLAQLDNTAFEDRVNALNSADSNMLGFRFSSLAFTKNNEYFNKITDGYTLFGYHLLPSFFYQPTDNFRIDVGAFLWKDFGASGFHDFQPTFTMRYQYKNHQILFGNLEGNVSHRLIEPLQDFESVILRRLEHGLQWKYADTSGLWIDAWIDWQKMIYPFSPFKEEVRGGLSLFYNLLNTDQHTLQLIAQFTAYHKGGQIDSLRSIPLITDIHLAPGAKYKYVHSEQGFWHGLSAEAYPVWYSDRSFDKIRTYKSGFGIYPNITIFTKVADLMISYWNGNKYVNDFGGRLYPSLSNNILNPGFIENPRNLLIFRFMKDFKLFTDFFITSRFEPFINLNTGNFEFSHGLYFNYRKSFGIAKVR